jgi:hypothetical protein
MAPGATIRVHSGPGQNTPTDIYMYRTTVMWDQELYDLAVLYDNFGREIDRFFPASDVGVTPTPPAGTTATVTRPAGTVLATTTATRPAGTAQATVTPRTPVPTTTGGIPSPVATGAATGTTTRTATPGGATSTPTRTSTPGTGACPTVDPSRMSEIDYRETVMIYQVEFEGQEFVDVFNVSDGDVNLSGWVLRDKNNTARSYTFPSGSIVPALDSVFVFTEPNHTYTFNSQTPIWDDCGAALELRDSTGILEATYAYGNHLIDE